MGDLPIFRALAPHLSIATAARLSLPVNSLARSLITRYPALQAGLVRFPFLEFLRWNP